MGEALLTIDTSSMEDSSPKATLDVLQEKLEDLGGINTIELDVQGIVTESSEQDDGVGEVSA